MTGLDSFDATLHKTNRWLTELMQTLGWDDKHRAYLAMRAGLHTLRDRLGVHEAAKLGAQLPMLVRGFYYEGWDPNGKPLKERHKEQFLARFAQECSAEDPARVATGVFSVLSKHVSPGEVEYVKRALPEELRDLWPAAGAQHE